MSTVINGSTAAKAVLEKHGVSMPFEKMVKTPEKEETKKTPSKAVAKAKEKE